MELVSATYRDVPEAIDCLVPAFLHDRLMLYFFPGEPDRRAESIRDFFTILMKVRIELGMPALVLKDDRSIAGAVMGYDTRRPEWPDEQSARWDALAGTWSGLSDRMDTYAGLAKKYEPQESHFYLGVLGVHPNQQGKGAGRRLIDAYCSLSDQDNISSGTYLETGEAENLAFYHRCGFEVTGSAALDEDTMLYCLFRPDRRTGSR